MLKRIPVKLHKGEIEKRIWGHRLYDEQGGMMTLLEFLCILAETSFEKQNPDKIFNEDTYYLKPYKAPRRLLLRSLIFNNPYIDENYKNSGDPWRDWCKAFISDEQNKKLIATGDIVNIEYFDSKLPELQSMFSAPRKGYDEFKLVIQTIRQAGINIDSGKRWTSRFIFPWGRNCLFLDVDDAGGAGDRRFFARNGEIVFMMLSFADRREELEQLIQDTLLDSNNSLDAICKALSFGYSDEKTIGGKVGEGCVLPLDFFTESKRRINILCEDLISAFKLPIPAPDRALLASRLISLNLFCYFLEQSLSVINQFDSTKKDSSRSLVVLCEALQKRNSSLREVSQKIFQKNSELSIEAISMYYYAHNPNANLLADDTTEEEENEEPGDAYEDNDDESDNNENEQIESLPVIIKNHTHHWGSNLHRFLAKDCGLASNICTKNYRYAPSDALLESLAAVCIPRKRLLLANFLKEIYERYGIIFGFDEFEKTEITSSALKPDRDELTANLQRLEARLKLLGLLESLSDGCNFILNPYQSKNQEK